MSSQYTKKDILRMVQEQDAEFIRLQFTDIFGRLKNVAIMASQTEKALKNQVMIDGSSVEGFTRIHESDQYLVPDRDTFAILPWRPRDGSVARLICEVYNPDGTPSAGDPRQILKRQLEEAAKEGYEFNVGPECEFFLFETDESGAVTTKTGDEAGYFDLSPIDHGETTRREICMNLEAMGFEVETSHHEVAHGQHEIDFKYADALTTADNIMTFKLAVKSIAQENGLYATFMPKPVNNTDGSGMHINMSIYKDGQNIFADAEDSRGLSAEAYHFIAGIMKHIKAITAITNPLVNSYKRLVPGYEAPCYVTWSENNRSALIRIPAVRGEDTRIELRSPDPACKPYLALAVCLAAGLDGMRGKMEPPEEITENVFDFDAQQRAKRGIESLPANLEQALAELQKDPLICDVLGAHALECYVRGKQKEWEEYKTQVSQWEIDRYMKTY